MRNLFISSIIFIASITFFWFEAPTTSSTPKKQDKGALPITPQTKKPHFDSLSNAPRKDSLHVKI